MQTLTLEKADAVAGEILKLFASGGKKALNGSFWVLEGSYKFLKKQRAKSKNKNLSRGKDGKFVSSQQFSEFGYFDFSYFKEKEKKACFETFRENIIENMLKNSGIHGFKFMKVKDAPSFISYEVSLKEGIVPPNTIKNATFELQDERTVNIEKPRYNHELNAYVINVVISKMNQELVTVESMLISKEFWSFKGSLVLPIGKSQKGFLFTDLAKLPHLLLAGTTGSGKSSAIDAMLVALMHRLAPTELKLLLIDPKRVAFTLYKGFAYGEVLTDMEQATNALEGILQVMEARYAIFEQNQVKDLAEYNELGVKPMERIVVVVDELADLMDTNGERVEFCLGRLAQKSRAAGIHLILATQRPTTSVIKGNIKANIVSRLSFQLKTAVDSVTILGEGGAEKLQGSGDGYFSDGGKKVRVKSPFIENKNIKKILGN